MKAARAFLRGAVGLWLAVFFLFPLYWALATALQPAGVLAQTPVAWFPARPTLDNFRAVLSDPLFLRALLNSAIVATATAALAVALGSAAGYALARFRFRGRGAALGLMLAMTMFPQVAVLGALYRMVTAAGLYNHLAALVLANLLSALPFATWVLTAFFRPLPRELEESAALDGCGPFATFWRICLPLAMPGVASTALLAFVGAWNEYLFAITFTLDETARTAPAAVALFGGDSLHEVPWGRIMAASVVTTLPLLALAGVFQRRLLAGLTAGAVKG